MSAALNAALAARAVDARCDQLVIDVSQAYGRLSPMLQAELERALSGSMNFAQVHDLADRMLSATRPDYMALVLTRLIVLSNDTPA